MDTVRFSYGGHTFSVWAKEVWDLERIILPYGLVLDVTKWSTQYPNKPRRFKIVTILQKGENLEFKAQEFKAVIAQYAE